MKHDRSFRSVIAILAVTATLSWAGANAADGANMQGMGHHAGGMNGMKESGREGMFLVERAVDGYAVRFHVMAARDSGAGQGDHHVMIQVTRGGGPVSSLVVNSKVIAPDGSAQTRPMMAMGEWFMAPYDMSAEGRYQLLILFKTPDGKKHKAGAYYPQ